MVQPFNYSLPGAVSPFESVVQGLKLGASLEELAAARAQRTAQAEALRLKQEMEDEKLRAAQEAQRVEQEARKAYFANPSPTSALRWQATLTPEMAKALNPGIETMSRDQVSAINADAMRAYGLLSSGRADLVIADLQTQARARRDAGDEVGAKRLEDAAEMTRVNPQYVELDTLAKVAARPGGPELIQRFVDARKATPELAIKTLEAKFAPEKLAAELQLTQAQVDAAKAARAASEAAARKSGEEAAAAKAKAEQMAQGVIDPEKRPELEAKMRAEYNNQTKNFGEVKAAYGRVLASEETAAGDLALIFSYMKMLDPGSVVREGEFATAEQAAGVPDRIRNIYNKLLSGERLNPDQRKMFASQAKSLYDQSRQQEALVRSGIDRIAKSYGLNVGNIFYEATETPPRAPQRPASGAGAVGATGGAATPPGRTAQPGQAAPTGQAARVQITTTMPAPANQDIALPSGRSQVGIVPPPTARPAPSNVGVVAQEIGGSRFQVTAPDGITYYFQSRAAAEQFKRRGGF